MKNGIGKGASDRKLEAFKMNDNGDIIIRKTVVASQKKVETDMDWRANQLHNFNDYVCKVADECIAEIGHAEHDVKIAFPEVMLTGNFFDYVSDVVNLEPQVLVYFKAKIIRRKGVH